MITSPASYWVDAGTGLFHDERASIDDESDPSQHIHLLQLWVGVKEADRKKPPRVQFDKDLPTFVCLGFHNSDDEKKEVVVGHGRYHVGPKTTIETPHPITVAHIKQEAGTTHNFPIDSTKHGGFVVSLKGSAFFGECDSAVQPKDEYDVLVLKNCNEEDDEKGDSLQIKTTSTEGAEYVIATGERIGESWAKKLVANGAIIAATSEEARAFAPKVEAMSESGIKNGGSFYPFGIQ
jgi:redox-sensitive bicupin YhaK (pirin superfamily)